ncbi:MAG TPA: FHA domain-containing protein [Candidatus Sulfomarinibacteraceae bacterium]|nr:FHA domain-containing protein [Candidatus Sulfomarinibacteraceae bacterium]
MAQFILVYTHPTEGEKRTELARGRSYRIGSRPDNDIVIDQKDVSRHHAVLRVQDAGLHVTDLDSKNGTFINGTQVASATFNCGDMVHLSSARLVIVEASTGAFALTPEAIAPADDESGAGTGEATHNFRGEASFEDVVSLLETTASAIGRGALAEPLSWAVDRLGFEGAMVLYRDRDGSVAMVSSAGDLGQLARHSGVLTRLANDEALVRATGTRVQQVNELDEDLLVATVGPEHVLVLRTSGRRPAIGDLRSLIAAINAVLAGVRTRGQGVEALHETADREAAPEPPTGGRDLDLERLAAADLASARELFEDWMIRRVLEANDGNQSRAAAQLGLSRGGLIKKMKKLGL